jgi:ATP-binding cassette subfamily F protein uup
VSFALHRGERVCLIGANGAGKSTLLKMLAGEQEPDGGETAKTAGVTIAYMAQEPDLSAFATLADYAATGGAARHEAEASLMACDLDPDRSPAGLSGGEIRRASLARAFAASPDILLLDEPTNHLDIAAITALEERLQRFSGACLIISHDRRFLENVSTACLWLRRRVVRKLDEGFTAFEPWAEAIEEEDARALARLETQLKAEEHWLQRGVTARRSRNEGRRRKLMAMRAERKAEKAEARSTVAVAMAEGTPSGRLVLEAKALSFAYPCQAIEIVKDFSLRLMRGDRLGLIGPNGAGKTTLLKLLLKETEPTAGGVRHGAGLTIATVAQDRAALDPAQSIWDTLCPLGGDQVMVQGRPRHVAAYASDFLFTSAQLRQPTGALSGGERNRLALALTLAKPANLLVLDEPTNDLDMETLDVLEDALGAYPGAVILVSHDRAFLNGAVTQVLGPLGDGRWAEAPGDYDDFVRSFGAPAKARASATTRPAAPKPPPVSKAAPKKLSYKDQRRLEECEAQMPHLAAQITALEDELAKADYAADPQGFARRTNELEAKRQALDAAELDWLRLEEQRAALEQG